MIFAHLIIAHLLGDFPFQPAKLVEWKIKSKWGTLVHVVIHAIVGTIILLPFILNGAYELIYVILGVNAVHFFIDNAKINYALTNDTKIKPFILDQVLHIIVIYIAYLFVRDFPYDFYFTFYQTILAFFLVLSIALVKIQRFL